MKTNLKALEAAVAYVCGLNNGTIPEVALIKILYEAERSAITYSLYSITGDSFCAYTKGPVLNNLLSLIRGTGQISKKYGSEWKRFFELQPGKLPKVSLIASPDMDEISEMDREYLSKAFCLYSKFLSDPTDSRLVHYAHKRYKEWIQKRHAIQKQDILRLHYGNSSNLDELAALIS